jgi:hypothetical protein
MATILLSAAGAAIGSGFGGSVLGLSGLVIGRAVGATVGRVIDQRILGGGSETIETGRIDRFRLMGASEGQALPRVWGRVRLAGQVIWSSRFQENVATSGGSKGAPQPKTKSYSYSINLAIALCEGEIRRVGRIWADGNEIAPNTLNLRLYRGTQDQMPDAKIEAIEGVGNAPAYRGTAYVVIENLDLTAYGNRVPQFSFEVLRAAQGTAAAAHPGMQGIVPGVCLMPGTGEYALATTPVHYSSGPGVTRSANVHSLGGETDFIASLRQLSEELPSCGSTALVVSWFGNDLRCGNTLIKPKVEQKDSDGIGMPWRVCAINRMGADVLAQMDGRSIYGGTPADASVIQSIRALTAKGQAVTFYPFVLMEQIAGNGLPDPWSDAVDQPVLPWRGRITTAKAAGRAGSNDGTAAAAAEVSAFFGTSTAAHFGQSGETVTYSGPNEWRYRRFILHYAKLCAIAGGVEAFCIGSELRGLTQIRGAGGSYPAVTALKALAAEVRAILGAGVKISYAADWTEYFGHQSGGDHRFHLDPLWSDANIDFVGIDNYMPLSDWRDDETHADSAWGSVCNPDYLAANIAGGEGFDWYYDDANGLAAQRRLPIEDGADGEPWVYRYKDLVGWWSNAHYDRIGGVRQAAATGWQPMSKPIRFVEYGCAAIDKGANQPNRFLDPKSSESGLPRFSNGQRDDLMQLAYLQAMHRHWTDPVKNPVSPVYGAAMVDFAHSHVWAWDARPYPAFPAYGSLWGDAVNYEGGHWLNGRAAGQPLAAVLAEICETSGLDGTETGTADGIVRGYGLADVASARSALQPLLLAHAIEASEREGALRFTPRNAGKARRITADALAISGDLDGTLELTRGSGQETVDRIRLGFVEAESDFAVRIAEAAVPMVGPTPGAERISDSELAMTLTRAEAVAIADRWLAEAQLARDGARFALPPSRGDIGAGDTINLQGQLWRVDRIEQGDLRLIEAVRTDPGLYRKGSGSTQVGPVLAAPYVAPGPVYPLFLDLPLMSGTEVEHAPHLGVAAVPWPGAVAAWASPTQDGFALVGQTEGPMVLGITQTPMAAAPAGRWDRGAPLRVRFDLGDLSSVDQASVLSGANLAAIGDGTPAGWEVFQFATATLVAPATYDLSMRLRGQAGSDGTMPSVWPAGSQVVLITSALRQIDLPVSARGLSRNYRIGRAAAGYDATTIATRTDAFDGIGLRPYRPCHLRALKQAGDLRFSWIRRTRIDGDSWQSVEVPLGEDSESYLLRLRQGATTLREVAVSSPAWTWTAAAQAADGAIAGPVTAEVRQVSQRFGPGPAATIGLTL